MMRNKDKLWKRTMLVCGMLCLMALCLAVGGDASAGTASLPKKLDLTFTSGAGGWGTGLVLKKNGKFKGDFHDSDMGVTGKGYANGTVYYSNFSGRFKKIEKTGDGEYTMKIAKLKVEDELNKTEIIDQVRYISSDPYGMEDGKKFVLYCPGYRISNLPKDAQEWIRMAMWVKATDETLDGYVLYNKKMGYAFFGN